MTLEQAQAALGLIKQASEEGSERLKVNMTNYLDASDRVLAQAAQLRALQEPDGAEALAAQLLEAAKGADPT